jgi:hypothetical protein
MDAEINDSNLLAAKMKGSAFDREARTLFGDSLAAHGFTSDRSQHCTL